MHTRPLGPGAPPVSAVGFGGMPLSIDGRPPEDQALRTLHAAFDAGMTLVDTADVYCHDHTDIGHNERLVAKALRSWPDRDRVLVATKGGMTRPGGSWARDAHPDALRRACDRSLAALGVDRIDLYQLHAPDGSVPLADSVGALADLQRAGKIRWVGISNVSVAELEAARQVVDITSVQNRLNPFFREALTTGVMERCRALGIGFLAYSPVGGGRLNRKLPTHPTLLPIAAAHGTTCHAVVLAWVLAQARNVVIIPGARTEDHARDAAASADVTLTREELDAIDRAEFSRA